MACAIQVSDLTKSFGGLLAVDHIAFEVKRGEIFGFLGPNGAGKTTTQRMLTTVLKPTSGTIAIMGYDLRKAPFEAKMQMGVVPESANPYLDLTAWQNLMLMGQLYGLGKKRRRARAEALLAFFGLSDRSRSKTRGFSKGMKQRLILAMALIHRPRLLFLDEPTAGLDVQSARLIREHVVDLNGKGTTVFLTTHNIEEAEGLCDRVAIIDGGRIVAVDRPAALRAALRSAQSVEVVFDRGLDGLESLEALPHVTGVKKAGEGYRLHTDQPGEVACLVADLARAKKRKILRLNTLGPNLEDVFVCLTRKA